MATIFSPVVLAFCVLPAQVTSITGTKKQIPLDQIQSEFTNPAMLYAPFMFWFWDTPLDCPDTRDRMVGMAKKMLEQGFNPGYAHARMCMTGEPDLPREQWLSDSWFETFGRVLNEAESSDAYFGYVDEYWWPSGRAAGRVLRNNPDLWAESLYWQTIEVKTGETVYVPESFFAVAARLVVASDGFGEAPLRARSDGGSAKAIHPGAGDQSGSGNRPAPDPFEDRQQRAGLTERPVDKANLSLPADSLPPHSPTVIQSSTLRLIGQGSEFVWRPPDSLGWRVYVFQKYYHPGCDGGRLNYLDRRLSAAFIREAHEPYAERFGGSMGQSMPGVFVDHEGDYGYKLAWSSDLSQHYRDKFDRDIRVWMPLMVDTDIEGRYPAARWSWFDTITDLYAEFFEGTVKWLSSRGMWAVSNLWEESLMWQASAVGDFFKVQRQFSMPGTDALGLRVLEAHDFMETRSVCEFENRRFQSEILGGSGLWGFNNVTLKQAANSVIAWGVSHVVPHGVFTTRKLEGNPWLPDWFDEHPFWPYMHLWTDFVRRAGYINSHGHSAADVLLLNPMDSVWGLCGPGVFDPACKGRVPGLAVQPLPSIEDIPRSMPEMKEQSAWWCPPKMESWYSKEVLRIDSIYSGILNELTGARFEFLIADREYVRQMRVSGPELLRDPFRFRSVILPAMKVLPLAVAEKVLRFAEQGGPVWVVDGLPAASAERGLNDTGFLRIMDRLENLPNVKQVRTGEIATALGEAGIRSHVRFLSRPFNLIQQHRVIDGRQFYWLANNTGSAQRSVLVLPHATGIVSKWDCETGSVLTVPSRNRPEGLSVELGFDEYEAFWLVFDPLKESGSTDLERSETEWIVPAGSTGAESIRIAPGAESFEENRAGLQETVLPIKGLWKVWIHPDDQPVLEFSAEIPKQFRKESGFESELQPWASWGLASFSGHVDYEKVFILPGDENQSEMAGQTRRGMAPFPENVDSRTNPLSDSDRAGCLRRGNRAPCTHCSGQVNQGQPPRDGERPLSPSPQILLDLGTVRNVAKVWCNGVEVGVRLWPPYRFDLSPYVKSGKNSLHVRVGNLVNNSYGDQRESGLLGEVKIVRRWE